MHFNFQDFEIAGFMGRGGYSEALLARHRPSGKSMVLKCAVKAIDSYKERVLCQADILCQIKHPNIITTFGVCHDRDNLYLVEEFAGGPDLAIQIQRCAFTPSDAVEIAIGITEGLAVLHVNGIIHQDIKPSNIVFCERTPKITDFGVAWLPNLAPILQVRGGTPGYIAPEAERAIVNPQLDIYSLGITLLELFTGSKDTPKSTLLKEVPLDNVAVLDRIRRWRVDPSYSSLPPYRLCQIISRAIEPSVSVRYSSVHELLQDLHRFRLDLFGQHSS